MVGRSAARPSRVIRWTWLELAEGLDGQRPAGAGEPAGRQDVVRARRVVARRLGRPAPDEDRARVADPGDRGLGVRDVDREVLGPVAVDEGDAGIEVRRRGRSRPWSASARARMSRRSAVASRRRTSASTASANASSAVTSRAGESTPCSACVIRSAATVDGSADASASTRPSDGPAGRSIATSPASSTLAAVTHALPGPTTRSAGGRPASGSPKARAPIAWTPPATSSAVDAEQPGRAEQDGVDRRRLGPRASATTMAADARDLRRDDGHHQRRRVRRGAARHVRPDARRPAASGARARRPGRSSSASTAGRCGLGEPADVGDRRLERRPLRRPGARRRPRRARPGPSSSRPSGRPPPNRAAASRTADAPRARTSARIAARRLADGRDRAPRRAGTGRRARRIGGRVGRPEVEPPEPQLGVDAA